MRCLLALLCFLSDAYGAQDVTHEPRIYAGSKASKSSHPYVVFLSIDLGANGSFSCTGSIVTRLWVLTAAHCYHGQPGASTTTVLAGTEVADSRLAEHVSQAERTVLHPDFDLSKLPVRADIALLCVDRPFAFTRNVQPIRLAAGPMLPRYHWEPCTVAGFGVAQPGAARRGATSKLLRWQEARVGNLHDCQGSFPPDKYSHVVCSDGEKGRGMCHGDSGGPLVCQEVQVGVVSHAQNFGEDEQFDPCGNPQSTNLYEFVGVYEPWLRSFVPELPVAVPLAYQSQHAAAPALRPLAYLAYKLSLCWLVL